MGGACVSTPYRRGWGAMVAIPNGDRLRPVAALDAWLAAARVAEGFVFRRIGRGGQVADEPMSDRAVARLVQAAARAAGYDPAPFGGHSLRAGFITSACRWRREPAQRWRTAIPGRFPGG